MYFQVNYSCIIRSFSRLFHVFIFVNLNWNVNSFHLTNVNSVLSSRFNLNRSQNAHEVGCSRIITTTKMPAENIASTSTCVHFNIYFTQIICILNLCRLVHFQKSVIVPRESSRDCFGNVQIWLQRNVCLQNTLKYVTSCSKITCDSY